MENVGYSATLNEAKNIKELDRITSFIYEMTKDNLARTTDRNFSFYHCLSKKLATLNSSTLEEELAPPRISPGLDVTQSPPTIGKCGNTEDSTQIRAYNYSEPVINDVPPPAGTPRWKESLAVRLNEREPKSSPDKAVEDEQPFNEIVIGASIFADEEKRPIQEIQIDEEMKEEPAVVEKPSLVTLNNNSNLPTYRLESIKCKRDGVMICVIADDLQVSPVVALPSSSFDIRKEAKVSNERKRVRLASANDEVRTKVIKGEVKVNKETNKIVKTTDNKQSDHIRKRSQGEFSKQYNRIGIKKLAKETEAEVKQLNEEKKFMGYSANFFIRVNI